METNSAQGAMMTRLQEVGLTITDLIEYLDTHLYDSFAIERYHLAVQEYRQLQLAYEEQFGPLMTGSHNKDSESWLWGLQDFPWDY